MGGREGERESEREREREEREGREGRGDASAVYQPLPNLTLNPGPMWGFTGFNV